MFDITQYPPWLVALVVKPFVAVAFLVPVVIAGRLILRALPDGPLKRVLSRRVGP